MQQEFLSCVPETRRQQLVQDAEYAAAEFVRAMRRINRHDNGTRGIRTIQTEDCLPILNAAASDVGVMFGDADILVESNKDAAVLAKFDDEVIRLAKTPVDVDKLVDFIRDADRFDAEFRSARIRHN